MWRILLIGVVALCGCKTTKMQSRILQVRVAADPAFRQRADWRDVAARRLQSASSVFEPAFHITWQMSSASEWTPDPNSAPEAKRRELGGYEPDADRILLGILTSPPDKGEPGVAVAFDPRVIVFDSPTASDADNQAALNHLLAHVLGAWHSTDPASILSLPPGGAFDANAKQCISLTRTVDFRQGPSSLGADATAKLQQLWKDSKSDPKTNPLYDFYLHQGMELAARGRPDGAVDALVHASEAAPDDVTLHQTIGSLYMALRRYPPAIVEFRRVVASDPKNAVALNNLGGSLLQVGQPEQAIPEFRKALALTPNNAAVHGNLGVALTQTPGHMDEGIAQLQEALRINPEDASAKASLSAAQDARQKGRK